MRLKMADFGQVLEMLGEEITKTHRLCLQRRRETECCVEQCRELFKPWPLKSKFGKKDEEDTESISQSQTTTSGNPPVQDTEIEIKVKEAEKQDLAALEGLLAKAQKAREIQTKIDEAAAKAKNQKKSISKKSLPVAGSKAPVKQSMQHSAKQAQSKPSIPVPRQSTAGKKPAVKKPALKSTYNASYGRHPSAKSLIRPTDSRTSAKVYLDSVLNKDGKGRHSRTAHKEQGNVPSTRTGTRQSDFVSQRTTTPACEKKESKAPFEESPITLQPPLSSENDSSASVKPLETFAQSAESCKEPIERKMEVDNKNLLGLNITTNNLQSATGKPRESSGLGSLACHSHSETRDFQDQKQESFDPFSEGAELTLPGKYRKLKATSTRLYSELRKIVEKIDKPTPHKHFMDRLESGFDMGEDISTHEKLQDIANGLLDEHENLSRLTSEVVNRSYNLNEDCSWPEVYKCYRHWQVVLSKFNELQRRTQQLLEVMALDLTDKPVV